jgi:hypothetical protein
MQKAFAVAGPVLATIFGVFTGSYTVIEDALPPKDLA